MGEDNMPIMAHEMGKGEDQDTIWVPKGFRIKAGVAITKDMIVGEYVGGGFQGSVWTVTDAQGNVLDKLVKAEGKVAVISDVEREWRVGRELRRLRSYPGFMEVQRGIREEGTKHMVGMEMEKIHGKSIDRVISLNTFNDINYVREFLQSVFTSLAEAQSRLGLHHADLRMANLMEHTDPATQQRSFKIIDYGLVKWDATYPAGVQRATEAFFQAGDSFRGIENVQAVTRDIKAKLASNQTQLVPLADLGEWVHRAAWYRKGDVYHVLLDLLGHLDARIWPKQDAVSVVLLMGLIRHVTGVTIKARFKDYPKSAIKDDFQSFALMRRKTNGFLRVLRQISITYQGWQFPSNPGITAEEALTAPFFKEEWIRECMHSESMKA